MKASTSVKKKKMQPYYIIQRKIILSTCISDLTIVDKIIDFLKDSLIIKYNKGGITRSLKLINITQEIYQEIKREVEDLLSFRISSKEKDNFYSIDEVKAIGSFLKNIVIVCDIKDIVRDDNNETMRDDAATTENNISYEDFCLCDYSSDSKFKIMAASTNDPEKSYAKYDSVCGFDILLILMMELYRLKCKKISKKNRDILKFKGVKQIFE